MKKTVVHDDGFKRINDWNLVQLRKLPIRISQTSEYNSIMIRSSGKELESGFGGMFAFGCVYLATNGGLLTPVEIISGGDVEDISWIVPASKNVGTVMEPVFASDIRTDCTVGAGMINFWGNGLKFKVGPVDGPILQVTVARLNG